MEKIEYSAEFAGNYRVIMRISGTGVEIEWAPKIPQLSKEEAKLFLESYRAWRDESLRDFTNRTGIKIGVVEL
jgi:hypothetical protein